MRRHTALADSRKACSPFLLQNGCVFPSRSLAFLTEHGEYYEASLKLEERVTARKEAWTGRRNNSRIASIRSAFFAGEEEQCGRLMRQETGRLMEEYRDYVAGE